MSAPPTSRAHALRALAQDMGFNLDQPVRIGGTYQSAVEHAGLVYLSGQIPRVGDRVAVTGRVGAHTTLEQARHAARICMLRALAILHQTYGDLDGVAQAIKMNVYVQYDADFTQHSEVADAASDILYAILAPHGGHVRTSIGVQQLPKNASVELDLVVALAPR